MNSKSLILFLVCCISFSQLHSISNTKKFLAGVGLLIIATCLLKKKKSDKHTTRSSSAASAAKGSSSSGSAAFGFASSDDFQHDSEGIEMTDLSTSSASSCMISDEGRVYDKSRFSSSSLRPEDHKFRISYDEQSRNPDEYILEKRIIKGINGLKIRIFKHWAESDSTLPYSEIIGIEKI